jgi:hypothetical protein
MSDTSMSTAFDILLEIIEHQSADGQLMRRLVEVSRRQPGAIFLDPRAEIFDGFRKQQIDVRDTVAARQLFLRSRVT